MFTMQAFRHTEPTAVHHFIAHDFVVPADWTMPGLHRVEPNNRLGPNKSRIRPGFRNRRLAAMGTPLDGDGRAGDDFFDALALRRVSLAQPLPIPSAAQAFAPAASCTELDGPRGTSKARQRSIPRGFFADLDRRFDCCDCRDCFDCFDCRHLMSLVISCPSNP